MRRLILFLIVITLGVQLSQPARALSQTPTAQNDNMPPVVIEALPERGEELAPSDPITLTFDQAMDTASVEQALTVSLPNAALLVQWADKTTLNIMNKGGWPARSTIKLALAQTARSAAGLALESAFAGEFKTVGPLQVGTVTPADKTTNVSLTGTKITVTFNRPMIALSDSESSEAMPAPFRTAPLIGGAGRWVNTSTYTLEAETLLPNQSYTVTIPKTIQSADGATLDADYVWKFVTVPIQVVYVSPPESGRNQGLSQHLQIMLSGVVTRADFEQAFSLTKAGGDGTKIKGYFAWVKDNRTVQFLPYQLLDLDSVYQVKVDGSVLGGRPFTSTFATVPRPTVIGISQPYSADGRLSVRFRTLMNIETLLTKFEITPDVGLFYPNVSTYNTSEIYFANTTFKAGETYTFRMYPGAEDIYGNKIETLYETTFTIPLPPTPQPPPVRDMGEAFPILNSDVMLTGAYLPQTSVALRISGKPKVDFKLYRVTPAALSSEVLANGQTSWYPTSWFNANLYEGAKGDQPAWVTPANLIRQWSETFDAGKDASATILATLAAKSDDKKLPPGLYWVVITAPNYDYNNVYSRKTYQYALAVSTANITLKRGVRETFVWLTDLQSAQPVPNTTISIYNKGKLVTSGKTDANGVFVGKTPLPSTSEYYDEKLERWVNPPPLESEITITADAPNIYSAWFSRQQNSATGKADYMQTDRPIYRPGEMVYFRGYLRDRFDYTYTVPAKKTIHVTARLRSESERNANKPPLWEKDIALSPYGSFAGEFKLPDAISGDDEVNIYGDGAEISAMVREFRLPEFEVHWLTPHDWILQGDSVNAQLRASYYAGGGVNNARVEWRMTGVDSWFDYNSDEWYAFNNDYAARACGDYYSYYGRPLAEATQNTDGAGGLLVDSKETKRTATNPDAENENTDENGDPTASPTEPSPSADDSSASCGPLVLQLEGTVTDESGQSITAKTSVIAHPTTAYVGIRSDAYFAQVGKTSTIHLIVVTPESKPVPNQKVSLEISRRTWVRTETEGWKLTTDPNPLLVEVTTGADGKIVYPFNPEKEGNYLIRAKTTDAGGRLNRTALDITALSRTNSYTLPSWNADNDEAESDESDYSYRYGFFPTLDLSLDKKTYLPGETAKVLIPAPFKQSVPLLVTLERAGVFYYEIIQSGTSAQLYEFKITDEAAPNATISVLGFSPINGDYRVPQWRYATGTFGVTPTAQQLTVSVKAGVERAKPGERVPVTITVKDRDGKPVRAEVGLAVTDKAALALVGSNSGPQASYFYGGGDRNLVVTNVSMYGLQERLTKVFTRSDPGGQGGAAGPDSEQQATLQIRKDYKITPLWSPHLETDADGQAVTYVTMPDNLTTWKIDARAVTTDTRVGEATAEFITTLPLIVRPATPRFVIRGDSIELAMIVNNSSGKDQQIQAKIEAKGVTLLDGAPQTVTVPDTGRMRVAWKAKVDDAAGIDVTFIAIGDGVQDAAKPALATGPNNTIPIYRFIAPDVVATAGTIRATGTRTEVIAIPPKFKGVNGTLTVQADPSLAAAFPDSFTYLRNYPYQCNEQTVSRFLPNLYTLRALKALKLNRPELEQDLDRTVKEGVQMLRERRRPNGGWGYWPEDEITDPLVTAYALLGLHEAALGGYLPDAKTYLAPTISYLETTITAKPTVSTNSWDINRRAFLLYALAEASDHVTQAKLDEVLELRFKLSLAGRAYLLMAYQRRFPKAPGTMTLLSDLQSSAQLSATGTHWAETETDWYNWGSDTRSSALALAALVRVNPNLDILPEAVRWLMNARQGRTWRTTQENVWSLIALTDWMTATKELNGNYQLGISLNRKSVADRKVTPETVREATTLQLAVTDLLSDRANRLTFSMGDGQGALYYTARLNLQLPADQVKAINRGVAIQRTYLNEKGQPIVSARIGDTVTVKLVFLVRDSMYYAVVEDPLPAGLETSNPNFLTGSSKDRTTGSGWYFDRVEYRDAQTNIHAWYLPAGTYTFTYTAHATTAGVFQARPVTAFAFYEPDVFGRTSGATFTVTP